MATTKGGRVVWATVLAIGFVVGSSYATDKPMPRECERFAQPLEPRQTPPRWASRAGLIDVGEVTFARKDGQRDDITCVPDIGGTDHDCNGLGTPEGEWEQDPTCGLIPGGDNYNAGCNSQATPKPFGSIACGQTICGTFSTEVQGTTVLRDTDWYEIEFTQRTRMIVTMTGEHDISLGLISSCGTGDCDMMPEWPDFYTAGGFYSAACNDPAVSPGGFDADHYSFDVCVEPGVWWVFVSGPWAQAPAICADYVLTLECQAPCHVPCCTGNDVCQHVSYSECIYDQETCGPGHYGGSPQLDYEDCAPGLCLWQCPGETLPCNPPYPGYYTIDNSVNSDIANPPMSCATGDSIGLLWFNFVAQADSVEISTCRSVEGDDSVFALYEGDCFNWLDELVCSEDEDCGPGDWLGYMCYYNPPMEIGQTYYIQFASWQASSQGVYLLEINCPAVCCGGGLRACCLPDGSCTFVNFVTCDALEGDYQEPGTDCDIPGVCDLGACCLADGTCILSTEILCDSVGVQFIPGADCDPNPCAGACCTYAFGNYSCTNSAPVACVAANQTFYPGEECDGQFLFECTDFRVCATCADTTSPYSGPWNCDAANCQYPDSDHWPGSVVAGVSDANPQAGLNRADDFIPHDTAINQICWWGVYLDIADPEPDPPPAELPDDFTVTYYASDANLCPVTPPIATLEQGVDMTVTRTPWGERILPGGPYPAGHQIWIYEAAHDPVQVIPEDCYWVEIVNNTEDGSGQQTRLWHWSTAPFYQGNSFSLADDGQPATGYEDGSMPCAPTTWSSFDLAFCLDVAHDPCVHCADICATATTQENEPTCFDGYLDTYNQGCSVPDYWTPVPPNMVDVECGAVVCGKTGTYECEAQCDDNDDCPAVEICLTTHFCTGYPYHCRDMDWYRIALDQAYEIEISLTGTAPMYTELYNPYGIDECRDNLGQVMLVPAPACHSNGDDALLGEGVYYLFTAPDDMFDGLICDEHEYVFHVRCEGLPCEALGCESCRQHGSAGRLCLDMGVSGGTEPRLGGIVELDITVDDASGFDGGVSIDCAPCSWSGSASAAVEGNIVTVTFSTALPDQCCCTVTLDCGAEVCMCGLEGDIDRSGLVSTGDASIIKPHFGDTPTDATAEFDFDVSGLISTSDFSQVKPRFGNTAPECP